MHCSGSGKTFIYELLSHLTEAQGKEVIKVAWSGIAADLLDGGQMVHSTFKLPLDLKSTSTCNVTQKSAAGKKLISASVIFWDEAPMSNKHALTAIDLALRDLTESAEPFGGKVVVLGGDFRQASFATF